jgi:hypothetical protein
VESSPQLLQANAYLLNTKSTVKSVSIATQTKQQHQTDVLLVMIKNAQLVELVSSLTQKTVQIALQSQKDAEQKEHALLETQQRQQLVKFVLMDGLTSCQEQFQLPNVKLALQLDAKLVKELLENALLAWPNISLLPTHAQLAKLTAMPVLLPPIAQPVLQDMPELIV